MTSKGGSESKKYFILGKAPAFGWVAQGDGIAMIHIAFVSITELSRSSLLRLFLSYST